MTKLLYRIASLSVTVVGGMAARTIFTKTWRLAGNGDEAPKPTDARRGWIAILLAAVLEGALLAAVHAVLDRAVAEVTHKLTGTWPGEGAGESR
jgi:hypothetical protein